MTDAEERFAERLAADLERVLGEGDRRSPTSRSPAAGPVSARRRCASSRAASGRSRSRRTTSSTPTAGSSSRRPSCGWRPRGGRSSADLSLDLADREVELAPDGRRAATAIGAPRTIRTSSRSACQPRFSSAVSPARFASGIAVRASTADGRPRPAVPRAGGRRRRSSERDRRMGAPRRRAPRTRRPGRRGSSAIVVPAGSSDRAEQVRPVLAGRGAVEGQDRRQVVGRERPERGRVAGRAVRARGPRLRGRPARRRR